MSIYKLEFPTQECLYLSKTSNNMKKIKVAVTRVKCPGD